VFLCLSVSGFIVVIGSLMYGVLPRIKSEAISPFFFGSIARMDLADYRGSFLTITEETYLEDLLRQNHINALILDLNFRAFRRACLALSMTSGPWAVAMALGKSLC